MLWLLLYALSSGSFMLCGFAFGRRSELRRNIAMLNDIAQRYKLDRLEMEAFIAGVAAGRAAPTKEP